MWYTRSSYFCSTDFITPLPIHGLLYNLAYVLVFVIFYDCFPWSYVIIITNRCLSTLFFSKSDTVIHCWLSQHFPILWARQGMHAVMHGSPAQYFSRSQHWNTLAVLRHGGVTDTRNPSWMLGKTVWWIMPEPRGSGWERLIVGWTI